MKKLIAMILSLVLVFALFTACKGNNAEEYTSSDIESEEEYDLVISYYAHDSGTHILKTIGDKFAEEHGLNVKYLDFVGDENIGELDIMLMAGDTHVDVFYTVSLDVAKYVRTGYYVDLGQYENLRALIESNSLVKYISEINGEYFGIPGYPQYNYEQMFMYVSPALLTYCFENIDAFTGTYSDPKGEELYDVFKYIYEKGGDEEQFPLKSVDYSYATCSGYAMMNPYAENKDTAALFLEYVFDFFKDAQPVSYPDLGDIDLDGTYLYWRSMHPGFASPIIDAYDELMSCDGSEKALRELAEDAARGVRMRLEG